MDLNLIYDNCGVVDTNIVQKIKRAFDLGYETVAINTIVNSEQLSEKNVKIPEPKDISFEGSRTFKILNRLTAIMEDGIHGHHLMQCATTKKYDIVAVQPVGEKILQHVCGNMDVDIICVDLTERLPFSFKRTYMNQAREKKTTFELTYAPCLRDQSARRWVISNAQNLVKVLDGRGIIVSSGAIKILELRGVHDVKNLSYLFGFKDNAAKNAVFVNAQTVLSHAGTRLKTGCGFVSVQELFHASNKHRWIVDACRVPNSHQAEESSDVPPKKKIKL